MHDNIFWYEACGLAKQQLPSYLAFFVSTQKQKKITHTAEI